MAVLASGIVVLTGHQFKDWHQLLYLAACAEILGGIAIQFRRTATLGAVLVVTAYIHFATDCIDPILKSPGAYNGWGNLFEQLSITTGAAIVYAELSWRWPRQLVGRLGGILLGICSASFALEQAFYLSATASLVPKWLPFGQTSWALATTGFFALAAVALLTNFMALLASRLLTAMIALFGIVVWIPLLFSDPQSHFNWSETTETFAIAGTAWILADFLKRYWGVSDVVPRSMLEVSGLAEDHHVEA